MNKDLIFIMLIGMGLVTGICLDVFYLKQPILNFIGSEKSFQNKELSFFVFIVFYTFALMAYLVVSIEIVKKLKLMGVVLVVLSAIGGPLFWLIPISYFCYVLFVSSSIKATRKR